MVTVLYPILGHCTLPNSWSLYFTLHGHCTLPNSWSLFFPHCTLLIHSHCTLTNSWSLYSTQFIITVLYPIHGPCTLPNLTPNMNLAAHITDCIQNHGPVYYFWLFAFDRMNGIMGSMPTNNHQIPVQLMRKLTCMQVTDASQWPSEFEMKFTSVLNTFPRECGSLAPTVEHVSSKIQLLPPISERVFDDLERDHIRNLLNSTYPNFEVLRLHKTKHAVALSTITNWHQKTLDMATAQKSLSDTRLWKY